MADEQVNEQELLEALTRLQVSDLLVQTLSTVSSLAYHRLSEEHRDLEQVRLAIEALRALLPVLSSSLPPELLRDFEQVTANLQLAYATVTYYDDDTGIEAFFDALAAGTATPRIIWISGTGAGNDIESQEEADALTNNATAIADFVNAGGGLVSHGSEYGWLFALLPGLSDVGGGSSGDLYLTPAGAAAFPGVTEENVNAGPWHNHFEGNFGGLEVLVRSSNVLDSQTDEDAAVVLGGASVTLPGAIVLTPATATNPVGTSHTVTATVRDQTGALLPGVTVTFSVTSGPNTGAGGTAVTDANGQATFTYTSNGSVGTDTIRASFVDQTETERSDVANKTWEASGTPPPPPPPPVDVPADIGVTKVDSPDPVSVGANLTYTLVVSNKGPGVAHGAALSDSLPTGVTFVSVATTRGSCSFAAPRVSCSFGSLNVGATATVTIVVRVDQAGTIVNTAGVATTMPDPNVGDNQVAIAVTTAQGPFTPPATPEEPEVPVATGCGLTTGTPSVFAGVRSVVAVRARYDDGSARADVVLTLRGAGKARTAADECAGDRTLHGAAEAGRADHDPRCGLRRGCVRSPR